MSVILRKIGNSDGVIIPKELLTRLNLKTGDELEMVEENGNLKLVPETTDLARQLKAARKAMRKYEVALRELAK